MQRDMEVFQDLLLRFSNGTPIILPMYPTGLILRLCRDYTAWEEAEYARTSQLSIAA